MKVKMNILDDIVYLKSKGKVSISSKIDRLKDKLEEKHQLQQFESLSKGDGMVEQITPWSLLLDLLSFFVLNYIMLGKFRFRIWQLGKHVKMIRKLWNFFEQLYQYFFKENINDDI